jgi:hypothetical protein|tara:strand:- start:472 stop:627 length:156 start_codon:yes stop_codon:yes gene_type:complete
MLDLLFGSGMNFSIDLQFLIVIPIQEPLIGKMLLITFDFLTAWGIPRATYF